jgi:AcrR family transcriptional regulator
MAVSENKQVLIKKIAFKYFLEKGYDSTNMRKISSEIGIKASSIYFYYPSKQALFISILTDILSERHEAMRVQLEQMADNDPMAMLYMLLGSSIKACARNSAPYKFTLRYHIFPAEEVLTATRAQYEHWRNAEFELCKSVYEAFEGGLPEGCHYDSKHLFHHYKRFQSSVLSEILLSGIMLDERITQKLWQLFWEELGI